MTKKNIYLIISSILFVLLFILCEVRKSSKILMELDSGETGVSQPGQSFEPMNFAVECVEGSEICWLYIYLNMCEAILQMSWCDTFNFDVFRCEWTASKPACRWAVESLTPWFEAPKKRLVDTNRWIRHFKKTVFQIYWGPSSSHFFNKTLISIVKRKMPCFLHVFLGGREGLCGVRQRPRVVQVARRLGEIPGNWDLTFKKGLCIFFAGRVQNF